MNFEASIELNKLHDALEALGALVDEAKFVISTDGITSHMVDPANVADVRVNIKKEAFMSWNYEGAPVEFALIDIGGLVDTLTRVREIRDEEEGEYAFDEGMKLIIDEAANTLFLSRGSFTYRKHMADPAGIRRPPNIPNIDLPFLVRVRGTQLRNALHLIERESDYANFDVKGGKLSISSGKEKEDASPQTAYTIQPLNLVSGEVHDRYSMDYLSDLKKPIGKAHVVSLHMANEFPIKITYSLYSESIEIEYMLAPRTES